VRRLVVPLAVAVSLAATASAAATIVLNKSIAGVSLGMTKARVERTLGKPLHVRQVQAITTETEYAYPRLIVRFMDGRARMLVTHHRGEKLASGVGVGSSLGALRKAVNGLECRQLGRTLDCYAGQASSPGKAASRFTLRRQRIVEIAVYRVID
jgi:hypothetical protein